MSLGDRPYSLPPGPLKSMYRKNLIRGPKCAPWKFYIRKIQECSFWTPGSVLPHENMDKNEIFLIQSIVLSDIKIPRGIFWSPCADYSCHTCSFKFTQITGIYMTVGRIILLLLIFYW